MLSYIAPSSYVHRAGVLDEIAVHVGRLGRRCLVVGGRTALSLLEGRLRQAFVGDGIEAEFEVAVGYPTRQKVSALAERARALNADVILGAGGGRALDLAKAAAVAAGIPLIAVPTVAATCAAWAALSILYTDEGEFDEARELPHAPHGVLVDPDILRSASPRYLHSGLADTLVKWYETAPNLSSEDGPPALRLQVEFARIALDKLDRILGAEGGRRRLEADAAWGEAVDAVILLAGLVGSIRGHSSHSSHGGFAHPFYNSTTRLAATRGALHGEKVGFGLLVQLHLESKPAAEIRRLATQLHDLGLPVSLREIGLVDKLKESVDWLAGDVRGCLGGTPFDGRFSAAAIAAAILATDRLGAELHREARP